MAGKKIGLFFGSFNPIHNGHLMIANYLAEFGDLDQVWFVISPQNPFKENQELLPDYHRRELLTRAIGDYPKFKVSAVEFQLPKPSYTIDTLFYLKSKYPDSQFILIMGSDQLPNFHRWKKPDEILANYRILVYPRPEEDREAVDVKRETEEGSSGDSGFPLHASRFTLHDLMKHPSISIVQAPMMDISSSYIRQSIKEGKDVRFYMPDHTWQYLEEMHFYQ
ncbi:MAG: nicotinate (nicotinamide) nucleotide adenylyltransferase [Bacteroidales bacterium]|jgi:nicotinate-nucleotide adenylyltransferase